MFLSSLTVVTEWFNIGMFQLKNKVLRNYSDDPFDTEVHCNKRHNHDFS